jgi:hypothetical protein
LIVLVLQTHLRSMRQNSKQTVKRGSHENQLQELEL